MDIILYSSNKGKIREIKEIFGERFRVRLYSDFCEPFEVAENGSSFQENALLKVNALKNSLESVCKNCVFMAEDSGLCVDALHGEPGVYSNRFANLSHANRDGNGFQNLPNAKNANDEANIITLIEQLKALNLTSSRAMFVSCVAIGVKNRIISAHGFLSGKVTIFRSGENGFGYDPIFIPRGFDTTLANLDSQTKNSLSHRFRALEHTKLFL